MKLSKLYRLNESLDQWVLVMRSDAIAHGPFRSEQEAEEYAKVALGPDYEHANTNADFFVCRLVPVNK